MNGPLPPCILFDLDGTLLDSLPGIAFSVREACRMVGLPEPKINLRSLLGPPIRTILSRAVDRRTIQSDGSVGASLSDQLRHRRVAQDFML